MKTWFQNALSTVDVIGTPASMTLFGREKLKSTFGGLCSILLLLFIAWCTYTAGQEVFSELNPKTVNYNHFKADPRAVVLSRESFPLAFGVMAPDSMGNLLFRDESIVTIRAFHTMIIRTQQEGETWSENSIETSLVLEHCKPDYFSHQDIGFDGIDISTAYCISEYQPNLDQITIQGVYSSLLYQELRVEVSPCNNETTNGACSSEEVINQFLDGSWFNTIYANMVVNPQNYTNPNNTYKDVYYTLMTPESYKYAEISLGYVEVSTDVGWLTEDFRTKSYTKVDRVNEYAHGSQNPDKVMMRCVLIMSPMETYYTRSYKKVQGVLAEVGGMANAALVLLTIATSKFFKLRSNESIMNELFDVEVTKGRKKSNRKNLQGEKEKKTEKYLEKKNSIKGRESKIRTSFSGVQGYKRVKTDNESPKSPKFFAFDSMVEGKQRNFSTESPFRRVLSGLEIEQRDSSEQGKAVSGIIRPSVTTLFKEELLSPKSITIKENSEEKNDNTTAIQYEKVKKLKEHLRSKTEKNFKIIRHEDKPVLRPSQKTLPIDRSLDIDIQSESEVGSIDFREKETVAIEKLGQKSPSIRSENLEENKGKMLDQASKEQESKKTIAQKINLKVWESLYWHFCRPQSLQEKMKVHDEGIKNIYERLDIVNVLKKLRELDKLRILLLDPDQLVLFNNIAKPSIQSKPPLNKKKVSLTYNLLQKPGFLAEKASHEEVEDSYKKLKCKAEKSEIDKRLIEIFEHQNT